MHKKPYLIPAALLSAVVLSAILGWMIADRAAILRDGREVMLITEPIDPRDMLRGRYMRLNYDFRSAVGFLHARARKGARPRGTRLRAAAQSAVRALVRIQGRGRAARVLVRGRRRCVDQGHGALRAGPVAAHDPRGLRHRAFLRSGTGRAANREKDARRHADRYRRRGRQWRPGPDQGAAPRHGYDLHGTLF
jgi:hypothetical protein